MKLPTITETAFLAQVIQFAKLHRWRVAHFRPAMTAKGWRTAVQADGKGFPDLVLVRERVVVAELKVGKGKATPEQEAWLAAFAAADTAAYVWTPGDWAEIERVLT